LRQPAGELGFAAQSDHGIGDRGRVFAHEQMLAVANVDPLGRLRGRHDRPARRKCLEQFQARTAAVP